MSQARNGSPPSSDNSWKAVSRVVPKALTATLCGLFQSVFMRTANTYLHDEGHKVDIAVHSLQANLSTMRILFCVCGVKFRAVHNLLQE